MDAALWPLFEAVAVKGAVAWPALAAALHPVLVPIARRQPIGRLRASEDSAAEIVTAVLERLHAREFAAIRKLCAAEPRPPVEAWLRVVTKRAAIDFMRAHPEYERATAKREDRWISLATLTSRVEEVAPDSVVRMRGEVRAFALAAIEEAERALRDAAERGVGANASPRADSAATNQREEAEGQLATRWGISRTHTRRLVQRGRQYLAVFDAVMAGHSYPEVAAQLGLTRREVELNVQYLEELLAARGFADSAR